MKRLRIIGLTVVLLIMALVIQAVPVLGATTADITVTATPNIVAISCDQPSYDFGGVDESSTPSTTTSWATIDNTSTVQTDQTISVTTSSWSGGAGWTHDDTGTPGADTAALLSNKGGTWGVGDVTVKNTSPDYIAENQAADTDYSFGIKLLAPTSFTPSNYQEKTITVRVSAAAG